MARARTPDDELLLGEWACLGVLAAGPAHGWAVATRLRPGGDVGRVWSLSRPLTYRALDQLAARGYVRAVAEERGVAGPNRTILAITRSGRARLRTWLRTPVEHLRDLRSELLLKLVLADLCGLDATDLLVAQRARVVQLAALLAPGGQRDDDVRDPVALWRHESAQAALRFLDRLLSPACAP